MRVTAELLDLFREKHAVSEHDVRQRFDGRVDTDDVVDALGELLDLGIVGDGGSTWRERAPIHVRATPLSTIVLNVNTGCNLSCTYCYKEDLASPAERRAHEPRDGGGGVRAVCSAKRPSGRASTSCSSAASR